MTLTDYANGTLDGLDALARTLKAAAAAQPTQEPTGDDPHPHRKLDETLASHQRELRDQSLNHIHNLLRTLGYTGTVLKLDPQIPPRILHKLTPKALDNLSYSNQNCTHLESLDIKLVVNGYDVDVDCDQAGMCAFYGVKLTGNFDSSSLPDDSPTTVINFRVYVCDGYATCPMVSSNKWDVARHLRAKNPRFHHP